MRSTDGFRGLRLFAIIYGQTSWTLRSPFGFHNRKSYAVGTQSSRPGSHTRTPRFLLPTHHMAIPLIRLSRPNKVSGMLHCPPLSGKHYPVRTRLSILLPLNLSAPNGHIRQLLAYQFPCCTVLIIPAAHEGSACSSFPSVGHSQGSLPSSTTITSTSDSCMAQ